MIKSKFSYCVYCLSFFACVLLVTPSASAETVDKIVARVGSEVITASDIAQAVAQHRNYLMQVYGKEAGTTKFLEFKNNVLDELILDNILRSEIKKEGLEPTDAEIAQEYNARLKQMGINEAVLLERLKRDGMSVSDYKTSLRYEMGRQRLVQKKIMPRVAVSDYDLQREYEKNIANYQSYSKFKFVEVFLTADKFSSMDDMAKMAQEIHTLLAANKSAAELIKKYSSGAYAQNGGDSGLINGTDLRPEIQGVLSRMKPGEVSNIMPTAQGIFVFKLISKADPKPIPFNEVNNQVRNRYTEQVVNDELKKYLMAVKDQTFVEIVK